jgi:hypothetical protein
MRPLLLAAALIGVSAAPMASANSFASAALGPITFEVVDLNLEDGITASITFAPFVMGSTSPATANFSVDQSKPPDSAGTLDYASGVWDSVVVGHTLSHAAASASLTGAVGSNPTGAKLLASTSAISPFSTEPSDYASAASGTQSFGNFTLSANTRVVFSAMGSVSGSAQGAPGNLDNLDYTTAYLQFRLFGTAPAGSGPQGGPETLTGEAFGYGGDPEAMTFSQSRLLSLTFDNLTPGNLSGILSTRVQTQSYAYATAMAPVPEPQVYAMLLAGLGLMGVLGARKRSAGSGERCPLT